MKTEKLCRKIFGKHYWYNLKGYKYMTNEEAQEFYVKRVNCGFYTIRFKDKVTFEGMCLSKRIILID